MAGAQHFMNTWKASAMIPVLVLVIFLAEVFYYDQVYSRTSAQFPEGYDLVLLYGGSGRVDHAMDLAEKARTPLYISGDDYETREALEVMPKGFPIVSDPRANTTDQNARYSIPYILQKGYRRVVLVTPWMHLPRALFLTRFYLIGSDVSIIPYADEPAPRNWWDYKEAWVQLFKFWGSLGRIILHWVGINNWPPPEWVPWKT
jgi:uncharacterized SAM-binding protein YcdF (DUF218 family)